MKPSNRKERLEWIQQKKGIDYVMGMYLLTDREVKKWFEKVYPYYKDAPAYERVTEQPVCLVCDNEVTILWNCSCGEDCATIDPDDPELEERKALYQRRGHI